MPRPLIIRIKDSMNHSYEPIKSPITTNVSTTNVSNTNVSTTTSKSLPKSDNNSSNNIDMAQAKSLVRSLISMYEDQTFSKPNLVKSKSLPYIAPSKPLAIATPEIGLSSKKATDVRTEKEKFDFESVYRKFETSTSEVQKNKVVNKTQHYVSDLQHIQETARFLLENYVRSGDSEWKTQVVSFLKSICIVNDNMVKTTKESQSVEMKKEVNNEEHQHTVKGMANFFERQSSETFSTSTPQKFFDKYFTGVTNNNNDNHNDDVESSSSESSLSNSDQSQGAHYFQENTSPTMKIIELKSYFESKQDTTTKKVEDTEEVIIIDPEEEHEEEKPKDPSQTIKELTKQIELQKEEIESISKEDIDKGSQINEELVQILIKLDDVFSRDEAVRAERKAAMKFVQTCIRMLRDKMRN